MISYDITQATGPSARVSAETTIEDGGCDDDGSLHRRRFMMLCRGLVATEAARAFHKSKPMVLLRLLAH